MRSVLLAVHRFSGLAVGLVLLVIGLTGSAIVFIQPLDRALHPHLYGSTTAKSVSVERVVAAARAEYAQTPPLAVGFFDHSPPLVFFVPSGGKSVHAFVDPATYRVRGVRIWEQSPLGFLYQLHTQLLAGEVGKAIVGAIGLLMVAMVLTGLVLWPGWNKWRAGFSLRLGSDGRLAAYDLHKILGITTAALLGLSAATGAALAFRPAVESVAHTVEGTPAPKPPQSAPNGRPAIGADAAVEKALPALAGAGLYGVFFPAGPQGTYEVMGRFEGEAPARELIHAYVDQYSGRVLRVEDDRRAGGADALLHWLAPLHYGTFGGPATQVLYVLVGVAPGALFLSGFWWWLGKLRRTRAVAKT
ncbi:PepSY-associated TM helix domain-containing protein [Gloeobacter violaceus]|uniref:Gll0362 protein n=1 Tax=Gloeobacter violaceus (strain ATCC 29082 / PCC 7421) TaxID=251221 RepID=Q7NNP8_GLOVI|nr:PepSY-associated TM helix domain-containing protein [Gloeobacter violaceus]BAC88303.1 gll0362 [Gloeobacter violaceus PCC 7421]